MNAHLARTKPGRARARSALIDPLATFKAASFALLCGDRKAARILTRLALAENRKGAP